RDLLGEKPWAPFDEHFAEAVRLSSNRIVSDDEPQWKNTSSVEFHLVAAAGHEVGARALSLPAFDLWPVPMTTGLVVAEHRSRILGGAKAVGGRPEVEELEVDRVVSHVIDSGDGVRQPETLPRALAEFVGVVVKEPVGVDLGAEHALACQYVA